MFVGPVFNREVITAPRSLRLYVTRAVYVAALFGLVFTAWLILFGSKQQSGLADLSRFGSAIFKMLAPLQLAIAVAFSALLTAASVAQEKDRRTLDLLLMTRLSNVELVLGKLLASMLSIFTPALAAVPLLMLITLLGGVSYGQVSRVVAVTFVSAAVAGSLGSTIALWRERTFQSLALTALTLVLWLLGGEVIATGALGAELVGLSAGDWAVVLSPLRAIFAAVRPLDLATTGVGGVWWQLPVNLFLIFASAATLLLNLWAIARVRVWNPTQETRPAVAESDLDEVGRASARVASSRSRRVWDNPILWREICTWAYGKKIVVVRFAYLVIFAICTIALMSALDAGGGSYRVTGEVGATAQPLVPLMVLGLILVNALAVTSLTNERDLRALDLLLVTDLTPKEIIFGKLGGIFYNSKEMILLPIGLCVLLWYHDYMMAESLVFLIVASLVMNAFAAMLGVHVGMTYSESRTAVGVSLSTVLFLLLGIGVCMRMMVAFQGSFNNQLQAFVAFMVGGGAGLYLTLGRRNPSKAIGLASFATPFITFYVITSYLQAGYGAAFLLTVVTYGFATTALLVPAIAEFDVATGRTTEQS
ncbi:MAG: ABC transporter permease subunit [Planctomycetota bacterium]